MLQVCLDLCLIVRRVHHRGLVHSDIRSKNVSVDLRTAEVVLLDMGMMVPVGKPLCRKPFTTSQAIKWEEERGLLYYWMCP